MYPSNITAYVLFLTPCGRSFQIYCLFLWKLIQGRINPALLLTFLGAKIDGALSYLCGNRAMNMTGVSRAKAINIIYSLCGIFLS
ncbi:hypothetical protein [Maridesulfovibrio sp.]|uniref:hypothetical protein n=1 Tax=Maridesulfovibrio sp. TaxID=2795000 RepID=UPI0039EFFC14